MRKHDSLGRFPYHEPGRLSTGGLGWEVRDSLICSGRVIVNLRA
ncbi:MAG TPA: hypothetical protein VII74_01330 [Chthoniobacterales bacterium]